ncbi:hypothetical protein [Mesobacillus foraminis]|uniref:Uncharacterized protein n=1 Tax=Mesobacillus foraminis TaxID=279826 RepID=A0A4R2BFB3_9BACI|nr:hypothetical protein [Mesobacillus foraminis]MBT2756987.1 hypothetical protein [Mesobacillus foraminis]TCN25012.1 hypothetical protein EV146_106214 [Mesobacillus foraminis]
MEKQQAENNLKIEKQTENSLQAQTMIGHSGNSDVDIKVNIEIETKAIAYGMLCSLYAKGDLTEQQLEKAISKLDKLIEKDRENKKKIEYTTSQSQPKLYSAPKQTKRRNWII